MGYRYCPGCDRWLETSEYTVSDSGQPICPDHKAIHGFILDPPWDEAEFRREMNVTFTNYRDELEAAKRQGLVK